MLDIHAAKDRAVRLAILTGHMTNMDLIHARQRAEGFEACFGRSVGDCRHAHCRWHGECSKLTNADASESFAHPGGRMDPAPNRAIPSESAATMSPPPVQAELSLRP